MRALPARPKVVWTCVYILEDRSGLKSFMDFFSVGLVVRYIQVGSERKNICRVDSRETGQAWPTTPFLVEPVQMPFCPKKLKRIVRSSQPAVGEAMEKQVAMAWSPAMMPARAMQSSE